MRPRIKKIVYRACLVRKRDSVVAHVVKSVDSQSMTAALLRMSEQQECKDCIAVVSSKKFDYHKKLLRAKFCSYKYRYNRWLESHKFDCGLI